ncbi:MAG: hypothetical protein HY823_13375 [Acidobacteria bacterium]|nr:hypothetical protein [Acidobacteriota bacterium]
MAGRWRRWNAAIHRDIGYLAAGLTIVYAVSGIAVNHVADWNPNYRLGERTYEVGPLDKGREESALAADLAARLQLKVPPRAAFQPDEDTLQLFTKEGTYSADLPTGKVVFQGLRPRPVLLAWNRLHLNAPKGLWTYLADLYALGLLALALTGILILKGPKGILGRGAWLAGIGAAIPAAFWAWWAWLR